LAQCFKLAIIIERAHEQPKSSKEVLFCVCPSLSWDNGKHLLIMLPVVPQWLVRI